MHVIAVTGFSGSGKTTAATSIQKYLLSAKVLSTGNLMRDISRAKPKTQSFSDIQAAFSDVTQDERNAALLQHIEASNNLVDTLIVDSIRTVADFQFLRTHNNDLKLLAIVCNKENRFPRILARERLGDPFSREEFIKLENQEEEEWGISSLVKRCDMIISNNRGIDEFLVDVVNTIRKMGINLVN